MEPGKRYALLSAAAALAAVAALAVAFVLARDDGDPEPAAGGTTTSATAPEPASTPPPGPEADPERCRLKVVDAAVTFDSALLEDLAGRGVTVSAVAPATMDGERQVTLQPRVSVAVSCDLSTGVIGLRGGVRLAGSDGAVDMRRWRMVTETGRVAAYFGSVARAPIRALRVRVGDAVRSRSGGTETIAAPLAFAAGGVAATNLAFGTELRAGSSLLGTLTLTVERIESP